ncbi:MAG: prepilin-type N-terminal cleavage/methylation domain-containing protein [Chitinivibrionales bacterium]|nr:prepilin-type N-terminal cleavage/methylation domain-containing protein [Chitinivibrionales bacterium]
MKYCITTMSSGFTLLELLITLVMISVAFLTLGKAAIFQMRNYTAMATTTRTTNTIRDVVDMLQREVHMAGYNPKKNGTIKGFNFNAIVNNTNYIDSNTFSIQQDLNGDSLLGGTDETIRYLYCPENLRLDRIANNQTVPLMENIVSCRFKYFTSDNIPVKLWSQRSTIRYIQITVIGRDTRGDPQGPEHTVTATGMLLPRN